LRGARQRGASGEIHVRENAIGVDGDERIGRAVDEIAHRLLGTGNAPDQLLRSDQDRDASEELLRRIGFGEIVVGACSEPLDDLRRLVVGRKEEHLHLVAKSACGRTKVATEVDAGDARHHPVEHQHVRALLLRDALENVGPIAEYFHAVVVAEGFSGTFGIEGAVVHDPHPAWCAI
jgi:hypothetical protein